jgi:hypothetical protein
MLRPRRVPFRPPAFAAAPVADVSAVSSPAVSRSKIGEYLFGAGFSVLSRRRECARRIRFGVSVKGATSRSGCSGERAGR